MSEDFDKLLESRGDGSWLIWLVVCLAVVAAVMYAVQWRPEYYCPKGEVCGD